MEHPDTRFLQNTDEVIKLVYDRNKPKVNDSSISIDPAWYISDTGKPLEDTFICSICHLVVVEPSECEKCEKVFCTKCIKKWTWTKKQELIDKGMLVGNSSIDKAFKSNCPCCK